MADGDHFELTTIEWVSFEYGGDHFGMVIIHQEQEVKNINNMVVGHFELPNPPLRVVYKTCSRLSYVDLVSQCAQLTMLCLLEQVSKLSQFSALARDNQTVCDPLEADRLRTMILAMVDVRVVLIKIADRLHNMRTLKALPPCKQVGIARETLEIYAPLANRLGVWSWKAELEDLGFECLNPVEHQELSLKLSEQCEEEVVMSSIKELHKALQVQGVRCVDLSGRPKNLYSIYKKMMK